MRMMETFKEEMKNSFKEMEEKNWKKSRNPRKPRKSNQTGKANSSRLEDQNRRLNTHTDTHRGNAKYEKSGYLKGNYRGKHNQQNTKDGRENLRC